MGDQKMKWLLVVYLLNANPAGPKLELSTKVEMESKEICQSAKEVFLNQNKRFGAEGQEVYFGFFPMCIQVKN